MDTESTTWTKRMKQGQLRVIAILQSFSVVEVSELMTRVRTTSILLTGLAFAALYFLLRSAGQTPDGLSYALAARTGSGMFHPHHLLYVPMTRLLFLLTGGQDAILAGVLHNLIWLVVLGVGAWRLAGLLRLSPGAALLATGALLASRGVLYYSTHVETYLPALACLTLFASTWFKSPRRDPEAVFWLALSILYHQTNVLMVVPLLVTSDRRRRDFSRVVLPAGLCVLGLYVAGWLMDGSDAGFVPWLLTYARADVPAWGSAAHFSMSGLTALGLSQLRNIMPVPESLAGPGAATMLAALAVLAVFSLRNAKHRPGCRFALVFVAVYWLFFLWWIPSDQDFFLATLLPIWWLALLMITDLGERRPGLWKGRWLVVPVVLLLVGNLWFTARPLSANPGPLHERALSLHRAVDARTTLVVGYELEQELLYYTDREAVFEGDALALRLAAEDPPFPSAGVVVVEQDYLRSMLSRRDTRDLALLRALLDYREDGPVCRENRFLPGDPEFEVGLETGLENGPRIGLLITLESRPTVKWNELLDSLAAHVGVSPSTDNK